MVKHYLWFICHHGPTSRPKPAPHHLQKAGPKHECEIIRWLDVSFQIVLYRQAPIPKRLNNPWFWRSPYQLLLPPEQMTARKSGGQRESGSTKPRLMACNLGKERKAVTLNFLPRDFDASPGVPFVFFGVVLRRGVGKDGLPYGQ